MKVLQIADSYYPIVDGVANVVQNYAKNLNKEDVCAIAVPKVAKKLRYEDDEEFEVIRFSSMWAPEKYRNAFPEFDFKTKEKLFSEDYDIFHAHSPFAMGKFAISMARKKKIPIVMTLHTKYKEDFKRVLKNRFLTWFMMKYIMASFNKADSVWTVSESGKDILRSYGYKGDIQVIPNGTDFVYPKNAEELINRVNALHNLENKKNVLLFVGRMAYYKNIFMIVEALKKLKDKGEEFTMIFVGGGFDLQKLQKKTEESGLGDRVIFTGSITDRELLQGYYLRSNLFLFPSTFDTSGIVKVEAATHNVPSVLVKGSCPAEDVIDGENGFLIEETAESLEEKLLQLFHDEELVKRVGKRANETLYKSWEMVASEVKVRYQNIIEEYKIKQLRQSRLKMVKRRKRKIKNKGL